jgi:cytochrome c5
MTFAIQGRLVLTFGMVGAALWASSALAADGKAVYEKTCAACHATGVANAPKFGDKAAWGPRVATGKDALVASVTKGKGAMPPKGGAADLSDDDLKAAVEYLMAAVK